MQQQPFRVNDSLAKLDTLYAML